MTHAGFGDVAESLRRSTVQVTLGDGRERGAGSGVIWTSDGLIVTNAHVARASRARVELWDGRSFEGEIANRDSRRDLASLRIGARGLPAATPGNSSALRPGELVVAVGNPLGFIGALTTGVVHALGPIRGFGRRQWVQAAIRVAPGNSGGPLADAQGRVVGINTMLISGGLALAVPSSQVSDFLTHGVSGFRLGVTLRPVRTGLLILELDPQGAAAAASLLPGDVLTGANGKPFESMDDLSDALDNPPGGALSLQFLRGGRPAQREVTVRFLPQGAAA